MRNHLAGRSLAGRGDHLNRLNLASPAFLPADDLTNFVRDTIAFTAPITITIELQPSAKSTNVFSAESVPTPPVFPLSDSSTTSSTISSLSPAIPSPVSSSPSTTSPVSADATTIEPSAETQAASSSHALNNTRRLPGGTIAAIGLVVTLIIIFVGFLVARKCFIHKRMKKRVTWTTGFMGKPVSSADFMFTDSNNNNGGSANVEKARRVPVPSYSPSEFSTATNIARASLPPPPVSYNNNNNNNINSPLSAMSSSSPFSAGMLTKYATVQYTFIPSLPDELAISTGEMLRVMAEYDDGWCLCMNGMGEQGMVPLECLVRSEPNSTISDQRNSKRISSLGTGSRY